VKSFKTCGIIVDTDDNENSNIHCIKEGNPVAGAKSIIEKHTAALLHEDEDPFNSDSSDSMRAIQMGNYLFHQKAKFNCTCVNRMFVNPLYCS